VAGDWIKMRAAILESPKLVAIGRQLGKLPAFQRWAFPNSATESVLSGDALRCVTAALLLRVWSAAREHGKFLSDDLLLPFLSIDDLDLMAGVPGIGKAMERVGWAIHSTVHDGVLLPNFMEFNVPKSSKERQKEYRERVTGRDADGDETLRDTRNGNSENVTPRGEERRVNTKDRPEPKRRGSGTAPPADEVKKKGRAKGDGPLTFGQWAEREKAAGRKLVLKSHPVFVFAERAKIPTEFVLLAWERFKERHGPGGTSQRKRQADWPATFANAVKDRWGALWFFDETGQCRLTAAGEAQKRARDAEREAAEQQPTNGMQEPEEAGAES
jgi:hypothetical protein